MATASQPETAARLDILDSREAGGLFLRGGGARMLAYAGAVTTSVAAMSFVARHLRATNFGHYVAVTSLLLIVAAVTEGGIATLGVSEFSSGGKVERGELMASLLGMRVALSLAGAGGAILFAALAGYPGVVVAGTAIASIGLLLANLQVTLAIPLTAELRLHWLAVLDFTGPAVTATGLVLLVVAGAPLLPFFAAAVLSFVVTVTITAALVRHQVTIRPSFAVRRWRSLLAESAVFAAATALGVVYFQVVVIAMSLIASGHAVGVFSLAFRILSVVNGIPLLLIGSAFPILLRAARDDDHRLRYALERLFEGNLLLGGWVSLLVIATAPFAVKVMGGEGYTGASTVLRILGCGVAATFIAAVFAFALLSLRMYRSLITINAGIVALAILLCYLLIPGDGARGAAITTLALEVALACAYAVALFRARPDLRPQLGKAARTLAALGLAFAAAFAPSLSPLLSALAGSATLAVAVVALRAAPLELWMALRRTATVSPPE